MSEDRIVNLEESVTDLRIGEAKVTASLIHLTDTLDDLNDNVKILNEYMNRGKGAVAVIFIAAGLFSALVSAVVTFFSNK